MHAMKNIIIISALFLFALPSKAINFKTLHAVNSEWTKEKYRVCEDALLLNPTTEKELVRTHLQFVEKNLRKTNTNHLTKKQLANRNAALDILKTYWQEGTFPINTFHAERTPYFIDQNGTACAVGHLIIETGFAEFAQKIHTENNYGYIFDLVKTYPAIKNWGEEFGFSVEELAWIQPAYGVPPTFGTDSVTVLNLPSCPGYANGQIILPHSTSSFYPSNLTPPFSATIFPQGLPFCYCLQGNTNYQITISDANNISWSFTQFLPDPTPVTVGLSLSQPVLCTGDTATILVSALGGTGGSYVGTGFFPRIAGMHSFTVTDSNLCTATDSLLIVDPTPLVINSFVSQPILCHGDSATVQVTASGGITPYTGTGANIVGAGAQVITVTDNNNCQQTDSINVVEPAAINISSTITQPILCNGGTGTISVTATGGTGPIIGASTINNIAGTYSVVLTDSNGCQKSSSITLVEPPVLQLTFGMLPDNGTSNGSIKATVIGGTPPYTYSWSNAQTADSIFNLINGNYTLTVTDSNGCSISGSTAVLLEYPLNIKTTDAEDFKIYPNPTINKNCVIDFTNNTEKEVVIFNILGEKIQSLVTTNERVQIEFPESGIFILKIKEEGKNYTQKIIVQ